MHSEKFVSSTLSRKQFQQILELFEDSSDRIGDDRNKIKIVEFEGTKLVVKSFKRPNLLNRFVYRYFRKSKAERSYANAHYLLKHGIGTPAPVAYLEVIDKLGFYDSYYVSEFLEHDFTFRALIQDDSIERKEQILKEFAQFMYQLHETGVYFLDNSPGNTLITIEDDRYKFALVDLNRMKFYDIPYLDRLTNFERLGPVKWMYEVMGAEYARLSDQDELQTIATMWNAVEQFQSGFQRKKRWKRKLKKLKS